LAIFNQMITYIVFIFSSLSCIANPYDDVKKVHLAAMVHLDLGYTNTKANICKTYFTNFLPNAMKTVSDLRGNSLNATLVWTEFSWLIAEFFDGGAHCTDARPTPTQMEQIEGLIKNGNLVWNANPLNSYWEMVSAWFYEYSISIRERLNEQFHVSYGMLAAKQTDVPGMSRNVIPIYAKLGIKMLHIGYNPGVNFPTVPGCRRYHSLSSMPRDSGFCVFKWVHQETDTSLIVFMEPDYGDLVFYKDVALRFIYTPDNHGAPDANSIMSTWNRTIKQFPNAKLEASTLDAFASDMLQYEDELDVLTEDIGDSWIYGAGADPYKVAMFREAERRMYDAVQNKKVDTSWKEYDYYMRRLAMLPEHNWGLSIAWHLHCLRYPENKTYPLSSGNWTNEEFESVRNRSDYQWIEQEWVDQRNLAFPNTTTPNKQWNAFAKDLTNDLKSLQPSEPVAFSNNKVLSDSYKCGSYDVSFDMETGQVQSLTRGLVNLVGGDFGLFVYRVFNSSDFDVWAAEYSVAPDFGAQGLESMKVESREYMPQVVASDAKDCIFSFKLQFEPIAHKQYGAPDLALLQYEFSASDEISITLKWFNKTATRFPEAMWLSFEMTDSVTRVEVFSRMTDPTKTVVNGTQFVKGFGEKATIGDYEITALDTTLVSLLDRQHLLRYGSETSVKPLGLHFNVYNNLWGTAFPQWYDLNGMTRFSIKPTEV